MKNSEKADILRHSYIFSGLDEEQIGALCRLGIDRVFIAGEPVFWDGEMPDCFYVVAEGQVKVMKHSSSGKEFIIAFFGRGEVFGEVAVFENRPYPASAQAVSEVTLIGFERKDFLNFLASRPEVSIRIINVLSSRLRDAQDRLRDFAGGRVEQRLAGVLLMLSEKIGPDISFTRQEIADMAGTTTETAIRLTTSLKERGIIKSERGKISITDKEKLRLLSEGPPQV